jgi:LysR family transcriptional regulator, low CO2-responsive transcriptional regulator
VPARYDNRISLQKLEVFCLVVELGGVSRAAEHLFVAQPVVTAHLQSLQKRLGVKLLYRDGRRMRLTDGGERVYQWARETLSRTRELMRELDGLAEGQRGSVAVASSMTVGSYTLPPVLARFREGRPLAAITLSVSDPEGAIGAVESGECDFAVIVADAPPDSRVLQASVIGHEDILLVAAPDYQPTVTSVPVSALADTPLVSSPAGHIRRGIVDLRLAERGARPRNVVIELGHPEAMKRATQDGLGMCLLFRSSVERELADGLLREVTIEDAELTVPLIAVLRSDKRLSPIQQELLDAVGRGVQPREATLVA